MVLGGVKPWGSSKGTLLGGLTRKTGEEKGILENGKERAYRTVREDLPRSREKKKKKG